MLLSELPAHLSESERACLVRYLALLEDRLGTGLLEVWLFGSAARGDMWPDRMPMHSDIDLLVLTRDPLPETTLESLGKETYPLFLECGRQIAPQFKVVDLFRTGADERMREFRARVQAEGRILYRGT